MNTKTLVYILKRLLLALLTVWVVITVTFFVTRLVPDGPFLGEKAISQAAMDALEAKYGLDKPVGEQYVTYHKDVVTKFDFGPSLKQRGRDVIDVIMDGMKVCIKHPGPFMKINDDHAARCWMNVKDGIEAGEIEPVLVAEKGGEE